MDSHSRIGYFGVALAVFLLICGFLVSRSILDGFERIDSQNVLGEVGWVILDFEGRGSELGAYASDLALMEETLAFFDQPQRVAQRYLADFFDPVSAELMAFDFAALFDAQQQYLTGVRYDARVPNGSNNETVLSDLLKSRLSGYALERDVTKIDLCALESNVYLLATQVIYDIEIENGPIVGTIVLGRRLPIDYEQYEGALGVTYGLPAPKEVSAWRGEGEKIQREDIYPVMPNLEEDLIFPEGEDLPFVDGEDSLLLSDDELKLEALELIDQIGDLEVFEQTQYFRLPESAIGPDGLQKTQVMCSIGGSYDDASVVLKILVPQTISVLAGSKARLVNIALFASVLLIVAFTWFAVREIRRRLVAEGTLRMTNHQLEEANGQKDRLFSIIGHDMRAPLNGMIRLSELMARAPDSFAAQDVARFANNINLTGKQLHGLLENLLNWARLQTGQLPFDPVILDLPTVAKQVASLYRPRAEEKGIDFDLDVSDGMTIRADAEMLKTVLRNLVSNAIKFTENGGSVGVSASELEGSVRISVTDTGKGMSGDEVEELFALNTKNSDRSAPEEEHGSGFGLLLCQEMVRRHDSELEVYSDPGVGSEFSFSLPAK